MSTAYWIVAGVLALMYLFSGGSKLLRSKDELRPRMAWVDSMPLSYIRGIGALELLGAIGLILPPLLDILPKLSIAAAIGLVLVQIGAAALHIRRGETNVVWVNGILLVLAAVAAWLAYSSLY